MQGKDCKIVLLLIGSYNVFEYQFFFEALIAACRRPKVEFFEEKPIKTRTPRGAKRRNGGGLLLNFKPIKTRTDLGQSPSRSRLLAPQQTERREERSDGTAEACY